MSAYDHLPKSKQSAASDGKGSQQEQREHPVSRELRRVANNCSSKMVRDWLLAILDHGEEASGIVADPKEEEQNLRQGSEDGAD